MASRIFNVSSLRIGVQNNASVYHSTRSINNPGFAKYSKRFAEKMPSAGLADVYPGTPESTATPNTAPTTAKLSTLSNGIRVASIYSPSNPIASVRVYVNSGSRHESRAETGITHLLKHLAFLSTRSIPGVLNTRFFEYLGANFTATAGRENILFEAEVLPEHAQAVVGALGELLHPRVLYHEVERQKPILEEEVNYLSSDPVTSLIELVHRQAFRNRGLGNPLIAPLHNIHHLSHGSIANYVNTHYTRNNTVIVASGIPHDELVQAIETKFSTESSQTEEDTTPSNPTSRAAPEQSKYVGGEASIPDGGNTHIALAFEGVSTKDVKDAGALAVIQKLLGGGFQTSRDGPGVGLQSRLNNNVVVPNKNVKTAFAFNINYSDTGLFGVYAEASGDIQKAVESIVSEVSSVLGAVDATELNRAKQLLKLDILTGKRQDTLQFVAQQALSGASSITTPEDYAKSIDNVSAADITRVARRVFSSRPTLVAQGDVSSLPQVETIHESLSKKVKQ